ncbi:unnamed protein product [Closterium sp. Yama58-4]|nr:unnamed protein product [Closterium sp. Yama58-4]
MRLQTDTLTSAIRGGYPLVLANQRRIRLRAIDERDRARNGGGGGGGQRGRPPVVWERGEGACAEGRNAVEEERNAVGDGRNAEEERRGGANAVRGGVWRRGADEKREATGGRGAAGERETSGGGGAAERRGVEARQRGASGRSIEAWASAGEGRGGGGAQGEISGRADAWVGGPLWEKRGDGELRTRGAAEGRGGGVGAQRASSSRSRVDSWVAPSWEKRGKRAWWMEGGDGGSETDGRSAGDGGVVRFEEEGERRKRGLYRGGEGMAGEGAGVAFENSQERKRREEDYPWQDAVSSTAAAGGGSSSGATTAVVSGVLNEQSLSPSTASVGGPVALALQERRKVVRAALMSAFEEVKLGKVYSRELIRHLPAYIDQLVLQAVALKSESHYAFHSFPHRAAIAVHRSAPHLLARWLKQTAKQTFARTAALITLAAAMDADSETVDASGAAAAAAAGAAGDGAAADSDAALRDGGAPAIFVGMGESPVLVEKGASFATREGSGARGDGGEQKEELQRRSGVVWVRDYIEWLHRAGVKHDVVGRIVVRNPAILATPIPHLQARVDYLVNQVGSFQHHPLPKSVFELAGTLVYNHPHVMSEEDLPMEALQAKVRHMPNCS